MVSSLRDPAPTRTMNAGEVPSSEDPSQPVRDRASIRGLVEKDRAELADVAMAGGNVHQRSLDQMDRIRAQIRGLTDDEQARVLRLYTEETLASAAATNERARLLEVEAASQQSFGEQVGRGLVAAAVILAVFFVCSR